MYLFLTEHINICIAKNITAKHLKLKIYRGHRAFVFENNFHIATVRIIVFKLRLLTIYEGLAIL